eukprot:jgi/Psemu1/24626/gm1.24626_g
MMSSSLNENQRLNTNTNTNTNTNHPDEHDHRFAYGDNSNPFASPEGTILSPGNSVFEDSPYPFAEGYASSRARTTTNNQARVPRCEKRRSDNCGCSANRNSNSNSNSNECNIITITTTTNNK